MKPSEAGIRIPSATYRLQFNRDFPFESGRRLLPYLEDLGVSDCYCSPIFAAPPDSNHGYDVCDVTRINPVLGGRAGWDAFSEDLRARGMGLLLDFVPNHMGAVPQLNHWWTDVLEFGISSPFSGFFDIDWKAPHLPVQNKVVLPVLPDHYGKVLDAGGIRLKRSGGDVVVSVGTLEFPLQPASKRHILKQVQAALPAAMGDSVEPILQFLQADSADSSREDALRAKELLKELSREPEFEAALDQVLSGINNYNEEGVRNELHRLLEGQAYRLVYWWTGTRCSNYRRFFEVDSLVALKMEQEAVFNAVHQELLRLVAQRQITGLRLDHVDGLANPEEYLRRLQTTIRRARALDAVEDAAELYILVEKITMEGEPLRNEWPVAGTTGYEFAREVTGVLLNQESEAEISRIYREFTGNDKPLEEGAYAAKKLVMSLALAKEISSLAGMLHRCAERRLDTRDLLYDELRSAVRETIACFPVYRTYRTEKLPVDDQDAEIILRALVAARGRNTEVEPMAFDLLQEVLVGGPSGLPPQAGEDELFIRRFQQTTGGVMAKGHEDTVLYGYNRLNALNEVGGNPATYGISPQEFHRLNLERSHLWPNTMLTTSTHDTKTSEDVRARLAAISEMPKEWETFLSLAARSNASEKRLVAGREAPDHNEEYLLYQILTATWPLQPFSEEAKKQYVARIQAYMTKAINEAKVNSRWDRRNSQWEDAVSAFVSHLVVSPGKEYWEGFQSFSAAIARLGAINSLSQLLLKMTCPGVPDFYQGNEIWNFILVDPDNRSQVDFNLRERMSKQLREARLGELVRDWHTGAIKMYLMRTMLRFRREHQELFRAGRYEPLECTGTFAECCLAFARTSAERKVIVLAPRRSRLVGFPAVGDRWRDTIIDIAGMPGGRLRDLFSGRTFVNGPAKLGEIFHEAPFAVLVST